MKSLDAIKVAIGSQWAPGERVSRSADATFVAVNQSDIGRDALRLQSALLAAPKRKISATGSALPLYIVAAVTVAVYFLWSFRHAFD